jgi:glutamate decarboxylase
VIAKKYNCWLHVDGSWGGSAIFSTRVQQETNWFDGSELADTFVLNPHKLLGVPLQCSMLITPHKGHLLFATSNSLKADYLFHGNPYDLGAGTIGCGRRPDAVKIFLAWKFYGRLGLASRVDRALQLARQFTDLVRSRKNFQLVVDPSPFLQICFWFVPPQLADADLSKVTRELHRRVNQKGEFLVDHAPLYGVPDFFRIVVNNPTVNLYRDLVRLLDVIEETNASVGDWSLFFLPEK